MLMYKISIFEIIEHFVEVKCGWCVCVCVRSYQKLIVFIAAVQTNISDEQLLVQYCKFLSRFLYFS